MFKNFATGFGAVLVLVYVGMATNVQAKLNQAMGFGPVEQSVIQPKFTKVDCRQGEATLKDAGFDHIFATDCSGVQYRFNGFREAKEYTIVFNAQSNGYTVVTR